MTFLKKLGIVLAKGLQVVVGFGPIVTQLVPGAGPVVAKVVSELQQFAAIIASVEAAGVALQLPGAQKLVAATPLFAQALLQSDAMVGHKVKDPVLFNKAAAGYAQATVDFLNSLHEDGVQTVNKD